MRGQGSRQPTLGPSWTLALSLLLLGLPFPQFLTQEGQRPRPSLWSPAGVTCSSLCCPGVPATNPTCPGSNSVPTKPSRPGSVERGRRRKPWSPHHGSHPGPPKMARWRWKVSRMRTPSPGTERRARTPQRDGGGPATEAETNGAPGERDRQEILLNQDTAPNVIAVITISSM